MKTNLTILILISLLILSSSLYSDTVHFRREAKCAVFMINGDVRTDIINYMSTGVNKMGFENSSKISLFDIWMMNFESNQWNYPDERAKLSNSLDTLFLRDGRILKDKVRSYSTRRRVFYLRDNREIYVAKVKRIYFCCTKLPDHYRKKLPQDTIKSSGPTRFVMKNGNKINGTIAWTRGNGSYFKLKSGVQIPFHNLRRVIFQKRRPVEPITSRAGFVVLRNGKVINAPVVSYDSGSKVFKFRNRMPVHIDQVAIVNFTVNRHEVKKYKNRIRRVQ